MSKHHVLSALMVAVVWGFNFIAMKTIFVEVPPFLFLVLRLALTAFPLILFYPRPELPFSLLLWISVFQWTLHFALLFSGMYLGLSGGVTSLIIQSQVIFTILLTCMYYKSRPSLFQVAGLSLSFAGLVFLTTQGNCSSNVLGILLVLCASLAVSISNILYRSVPEGVNIPSLIIWSSALALPQALVLSLVLEGSDVMRSSIVNLGWQSGLALIYTVFISTMIGTVAWCRLMQTADTIKIVPFMLLVPVLALTSGWLFMEEIITWLEIAASVIIICGLLVNQLASARSAQVVTLQNNEEVSLKKAA